MDGERTAKKKAENETDEDFQSRKLGLRSYRRKLLEDARRAQQVEGNVRKARQLNAKADALEGEIARAEKTITDLEKRIETDPQGQAIPATERPKYYHLMRSKQSEAKRQLKDKEKPFRLALITEKRSWMKNAKCFVG